MKFPLVQHKSQSGFTLVELMVVVAIIGLLSSVAIPNFKKYQSKSRVAEAKLQLSALYTAQQSFFANYNMYAKCLRYMGFDPYADAGRYYSVGIPNGLHDRDDTAHAAAVSSGMNAASCPDDTAHDFAGPGMTWYEANKGVGNEVISNSTEGQANPAGASVPLATCTDAGLASATQYGSCIGTQANASRMVFQAMAVGIISADYMTPATCSGLNINQSKIIKTASQGY